MSLRYNLSTSTNHSLVAWVTLSSVFAHIEVARRQKGQQTQSIRQNFIIQQKL